MSQLQQRKNPFELENDNHFRVALGSAIWDLIPFDIPPDDLIARMATLRHHERLFLTVDLFDSNACADGVGHCFYYGYGVLLPFMLEGLHEIGAEETAVGLQKYVATVFGDSLPEDVVTMQHFLNENQEIEEQADNEFAYHTQDEKVIRLLAAWARTNRSHFRVS